jgi:hypothetical protein
MLCFADTTNSLQERGQMEATVTSGPVGRHGLKRDSLAYAYAHPGSRQLKGEDNGRSAAQSLLLLLARRRVKPRSRVEDPSRQSIAKAGMRAENRSVNQ